MARYDRLAYAAALVLGWDIFVAFLADELLGYLEGRFGHRETFRKIHDQEVPRLRDFPSMSGRYGHWVGLDLASLWTALDEIRATRNAIVHNVGCYTADYLALPSRRLPEDNSFLRDASPDWLLNQELLIPA